MDSFYIDHMLKLISSVSFTFLGMGGVAGDAFFAFTKHAFYQ